MSEPGSEIPSAAPDAKPWDDESLPSEERFRLINQRAVELSGILEDAAREMQELYQAYAIVAGGQVPEFPEGPMRLSDRLKLVE